MDQYFEKLKERLLDHEISHNQVNTIIQKYQTRFKKNQPVKPVEEEVEDIIQEYDLKLKENPDREISTVIAWIPFVSIISYLFLGFVLDFWHPGWMVFIAVPIIFLIFSVFHDDISVGFLALIPFLIIFSYFYVGFYYHIWHPTWLIFILLPVIGVFSRYRKRDLKFFLFALSPFVAISAYILLGDYLNLWSRSWVVFLLVPMSACLQETDKKRLWICEISLLVSMLIGIILPFFTSSWGFSFFGLLIPLIILMYMGEDSIVKITKDSLFDFSLFIMILVIYLLLGLFADAWAWAWMLVMLLPAYELIKQSPNHFKFYYIMPFISIAIFYSLGFFLGLWAFSWLAFILIPITIYLERD
jgi:hypothetical protein